MFLKNVNKIINHFFVLLITIYQKIISPIFPDSCRFYPSCSTYAKSAFLKYGFLKAMYLSSWRILRCNPWSRGGFDPLP
ncbi:MAG: membrane protein insertion efficiency factor YidD [Candidatus Celaenobacter antarcticus]|nr:membrane protein insertion efficiency factor YidD [Candidatus Celaenobacter antarcticus]MDP8314488.1 membrane protein insertion efficiency factor YidD [Candidatus Celaenobacter antarcticus]